MKMTGTIQRTSETKSLNEGSAAMNGLKLFVSNRMEVLAEKLADVLARPPASTLMPEVIVVQSRGMERWISMQLASFHGICANVRFLFPRNTIQQIFHAVLPAWEPENDFDPELAAWRIMNLLPNASQRPGFEPLAAYLDDDPAGLKRFQLSRQIARLFDQYLIFRPEMILDWEKGIQKSDEEAWQAQLWRLFTEDCKIIHPAALRQSFQEVLRRGSPNPGDLPERLSIFGISYLPPFYLETLIAASSFIEVNFFLLNPSREFWFDIRSSREIARELKRARVGREEGRGKEDLSGDALYLEEGNSLLASLGTLGREFWSSLAECSGCENEYYVEPGEVSLLAAIQSDILNLRERGVDGESDRRTEVFPGDRSLQIHACHSPMREVEVLHDSLLAILDADPSLQPHDIVVMAPDIEVYTPFIAAVFETADEGLVEPQKIPYHIADRTIINGNPVLEGFLAILELPLGRFTAGDVLSLLDVDAIRNRFGLSESDLDRISRWVADSGIRWGIDGRSRLREGLPEISANSWRWGLQRLLLGYALPARENELFAGILPFETVEGSETRLLGILATFTERLFTVAESLDQERSLRDWGNLLEDIVAGFFQGDEDLEPDVRILRQLGTELKSLQEKNGYEEKISLAVLRSLLSERFRIAGDDSGFLSRGITFCSLLPMRSIPFRVVCLLGMNNGDYPRRPQTPGFDLMARHPRQGDRSRRNDDRYLFLEALLSARDTLYISYIGQSMEDNSKIPPSVVVSELLDYIRQGFRLDGGDPDEFILTYHPLQAFSPACFSGESPRLFSYSRDNCRAATALLNRKPGSAIADAESRILPEDPELETHLEIRELISFFHHPARYFLEKRLGVTLKETDIGFGESEPFDLEGLERYSVEQRLLEREIETGRMEELYPALAAQGRLPHGAVGQSRISAIGRDIRTFVRRYGEVLRLGSLPPRDIDLELAGFRLSGQLEGIRSRGLVHYRYTTLKARDYLKLWIMHLLLNVTGGSNEGALESLLLGKDGMWKYSPVEDARSRLEELLTLYREGMRRPLHLFPNSSWAYAGKMIKTDDPAEEDRTAALDAARRVWEGDDFLRGEGIDEYNRLCFGDCDPLDGEFHNLSLTVYGPLLEARQKEK